MQSRVFRLTDGSLQHRFLQSRKKIQLYAGGFANGKTSGAVIKALELSKDYPGSNGLIARSTYPKLNDTIRKEFLKWCPENWIKSFPMSANASNTCTLVNGTTINFRYVAQQGRMNEASTSNLLSATYDWMVVDQIEDPEITQKDFDDLLGRLRGSTPYEGGDPTMPETGPRWFIITCNPTRNWVFRSLVYPLQLFEEQGKRTAELIVDPNTHEPLIGLFEGSTYENKENLAPDFIETLEATYRGIMRDRFLLGLWKPYEGLVYPMYNDVMHAVPREDMLHYYTKLCSLGVQPKIVEAYDHGLAVESCYGFAFADPYGNVCIVDGFYEKEFPPGEAIRCIKDIRLKYTSRTDADEFIYADPAIFRRTGGDKKTVGIATSTIFWDDGRGIRMRRGNNDIQNGILKVQGYLLPKKMHTNPFTGEANAPHLYVASELTWWHNEVIDYYWKKDPQGEKVDIPVDKKDHAMDMTKYLLTSRPRVTNIIPAQIGQPEPWMRWHEVELAEQRKRHRYG
jgi:hypothetical protein